MISIKKIPFELERRLPKLPLHGALEVLTYKRNRGFVIYKIGDDLFNMREYGYYEEVWHEITLEKLLKLMKSGSKREFPRSRKIRIYEHRHPTNKNLIIEEPEIRI